MRILYIAKWSLLRYISRAMLSRALFVITLAPFIARLINLLDLLKLNPVSLQLAFIGAILFAIVSLMFKIFIPPQIKNNANSKAYQRYVGENVRSINFKTFFKDMPKLLKELGPFWDQLQAERLSALMPPEKVPGRLGDRKAAFELSEAYYELLDISHPYLRNALAFLLGIAILMMAFYILKASFTILQGIL